jgi:hypothetical protein
MISAIWVSCCSNNDSTVSKGYPYGDWHELSFKIIRPPCYSPGPLWTYRDYFHDKGLNFIRTKEECDTMMKSIDSTCTLCRETDFNTSIVAYLKAYLGFVYKGDFQPRVIINHKTHECIVELRGWEKVCNDKFQPSKAYDKLLEIPKPPDNYVVKVELIPPVVSTL